MKKILTLLVACLAFASCGENRVHCLDVELIDGKGKNIYCYYQGKAYDGDVWSSQEHLRFHFTNGVADYSEAYYEDGSIMATETIGGDVTYYDEKGDACDRYYFKHTSWYKTVKREIDEFKDALRRSE